MNDTFGGLYKQAKESGALTDVIPDGDYEVEIMRVNASTSKDGDDRGGIQVKVVAPEDDPDLGKSNWINFSFTEKAYNFSMKQIKSWGLTDEWIAQSETLAAALAPLVGVRLDVTIGHRAWGKNDENLDNTLKVHGILVDPVLPVAVGEDDEVAEAEFVSDEEPF